MDGNRRWATAQGKIPVLGHKQGVEALKKAVRACIQRSIPYITFWALSTENLKERSEKELNYLFKLIESAENYTKEFQKEERFVSIGDISGLPKSCRAVLGRLEEKTKKNTKITVCVAFNYGVQVGTGGFRLEENGVVVGNVYASGDISGGNNAQITGSAVSASSPALAADQINDTPSTPGNSIVFRKLTAERDFAQSFILSAGGAINKVDLYIKKNSNPGSPTVKIMTDNGGVPGVELAHGTLNSSLVTTNYGWVSTTLDSNPELNAATTYWLVVYTNTYDSSKYYTIGANNSYTGGQAKIGKLSTGAWNNTSPSGLDGYFKIYLGGLTGSISNLVVGTGTGGEAWAHTVTGSTVEGVIYCQTGSGNNKNCNTSRPDPAPQVFPISDGNIAEWKAQAEAGGTINGNYTLSQSTTLGPKKIIGNLTIQNSKTLTVAGTLWVTGNILIDDQSKMDLSSSYGTNSGVVVADGTITTTNNSSFSGSGSAGSYLMLLSESYNDYAIKLDNNVEGGILYARNGVIELENNAKAKELSAYKIHVGNNGRIDYESGLINPTFSSGPSGGYSFDSWREGE